jgi:hypothetical protein
MFEEKAQIQRKCTELLKKMDNKTEFRKVLYSILKSNSDKKVYENYKRIIPEIGKGFGAPIQIIEIIANELGKYGRKILNKL